MSSSPSGYVHVSRRVNASARGAHGSADAAGEAPEGGRGERVVAPGSAAGPYGTAYFGQDVILTAPVAVVAAPPAQETEAVPDTAARGFALYVGLDEQDAAQSNTSLTRVAQEARALIHRLAPSAHSHAAVALAPTEVRGPGLDVVRQALADPTWQPRPASPRPRAPRGSARGRRSVASTGVLIDLGRREVFLDGQRLSLTYKEFEILFYLVENAGRTVARSELLKTLWGRSAAETSERTIDVHVRRLRAKLGRLAGAVRTVRGEGYRFHDHPEVVVWTAPEYSI